MLVFFFVVWRLKNLGRSRSRFRPFFGYFMGILNHSPKSTLELSFATQWIS